MNPFCHLASKLGGTPLWTTSLSDLVSYVNSVGDGSWNSAESVADSREEGLSESLAESRGRESEQFI